MGSWQSLGKHVGKNSKQVSELAKLKKEDVDTRTDKYEAVIQWWSSKDNDGDLFKLFEWIQQHQTEWDHDKFQLLHNHVLYDIILKKKSDNDQQDSSAISKYSELCHEKIIKQNTFKAFRVDVLDLENKFVEATTKYKSEYPAYQSLIKQFNGKVKEWSNREKENDLEQILKEILGMGVKFRQKYSNPVFYDYIFSAIMNRFYRNEAELGYIERHQFAKDPPQPPPMPDAFKDDYDWITWDREKDPFMNRKGVQTWFNFLFKRLEIVEDWIRVRRDKIISKRFPPIPSDTATNAYQEFFNEYNINGQNEYIAGAHDYGFTFFNAPLNHKLSSIQYGLINDDVSSNTNVSNAWLSVLLPTIFIWLCVFGCICCILIVFGGLFCYRAGQESNKNKQMAGMYVKIPIDQCV